MYNLGAATLQRILDVDPFALPLDFLFPGATLEPIEYARSVLMPHHVDFVGGNVLLGIQSFLLRTPDLTILIDSCVGEDKQRPRRPDWHRRTSTGYLERLLAAGISPDAVDIVLCTHLHADHVGWNTRLKAGRWVPTFPNARYLIGRSELQHWQAEENAAVGLHNHGSFADSVLPVIEAGQCETVDDGFALARGISIFALPGHSPGQIGLGLDYGGGRQALFCGDAIHSPAQVCMPDWTTAFCFDQAEAIRRRTALFERSAGTGALLVPSHIRHAWGMRVEQRQSRWHPIFV